MTHDTTQTSRLVKSDDRSVKDEINFFEGCIAASMETGAQIHALHPCVTLMAIIQTAAATLHTHHPEATVGLMRAYADFLECQDDDTEGTQAATNQFQHFGDMIASAIAADIEFPRPKGRA